MDVVGMSPIPLGHKAALTMVLLLLQNHVFKYVTTIIIFIDILKTSAFEFQSHTYMGIHGS